MPVSKNRGGKKAHRKRSQERTKILKKKKAKAEKEFMDMLQKAHQEQIEKQEKDAQKQANENIVNVEELGDIGDGLELDTETTENKN